MDPNNPHHVKIFKRRVYNLSKSIPFEEVEVDAKHLLDLIKKYYPDGGFKFYDYVFTPTNLKHPKVQCSIETTEPIKQFEKYLDNKYSDILRREAIEKLIYREVLSFTDDIWESFMESD